MAKGSSGNAGGFAIKSAPTTPRKPRTGTASTPTAGKGKAPDSNKRAREEKGDSASRDEEDEEMEVDTPTKASKSVKMKPGKSKAIKLELAELGGVCDVPAKRARKSSALPLGMVEYNGDGEEDETVYESSASEFVSEDKAVKHGDVDFS